MHGMPKRVDSGAFRRSVQSGLGVNVRGLARPGPVRNQLSYVLKCFGMVPSFRFKDVITPFKSMTTPWTCLWRGAGSLFVPPWNLAYAIVIWLDDMFCITSINHCSPLRFSSGTVRQPTVALDAVNMFRFWSYPAIPFEYKLFRIVKVWKTYPLLLHSHCNDSCWKKFRRRKEWL